MDIEFIILDFIRENLSSAFLDGIMKLFTFLGNAGWIWILTGITLLFFRKTRRMGIAVCISLLFSLIVSNITLKPLVARGRPFDLIDGIKLIIETPTDFSFPSGHTSASFAAASAIFFNNKRFSIPAFTLAFLIGFSRLYLYVHFPSDVLAGCIIGCLCGHIGYYLSNKIKLN